MDLGFTPLSAVLFVGLTALAGVVRYMYFTNKKEVDKVSTAKELQEQAAKTAIAELELRISRDRESWHAETRAELKDVKERSHKCELDRILVKKDLQILEERMKRVQNCPVTGCINKG